VSAPESLWADAALAAALAAIDPVGAGGVVLRARAGPVRDRWLHLFAERLAPGARVQRLPLHATDDRLLGGLDLTATLSAGRPVIARGLLAQADGGVLQVPMAERMSVDMASRLTAACDTGTVRLARDGFTASQAARFGIVALDEGETTEDHPPEALRDRLAYRLDLTPVSHREAEAPGPSARAVALARARYPHVIVPETVVESLCVAALAFGILSLRAPFLALRAAQAHAALQGRDVAEEADAAVAARLVLAGRATRLPPDAPAETEASSDSDGTDGQAADPGEAEDAGTPPADNDGAPEAPEAPTATPGDADESLESAPSNADMTETILAAVQAALSPGQLAALQAGTAGARGRAGKAGARTAGSRRGRRVGVRPGQPRGGARLDLVATLQAAAPWQRLRGRTPGTANGAAGRIQPGRIQVRPDDCRVVRTRQRAGTTTVFAVDASGSAALHRLAEAKGAVELLLGDCYLRRDQVALVAFRGAGAETLLPPTRSFTRVKRQLAGLPGGGGTPLASGLDAALGLSEAIQRRGDSATVVVLTDGRANIARDGSADRDQARDDARTAARRLRAAGVTTLFVDTSTRPREDAATLAGVMGARYVPLPHADAAALSRVVRESGRTPGRSAPASEGAGG